MPASSGRGPWKIVSWKAYVASWALFLVFDLLFALWVVPLRVAVRVTMLTDLPFAAMGVAILWLAYRVPYERDSPRSVLLNVAGCCGLVLAYALFRASVTPLTPWVRAVPFPERVAQQLPPVLLLFAHAQGSAHAVMFYWRARRRREERAELRLRLERARLDALRSQMQPRFLFDAFGTVSALLHHDPARADRVLARLGDMLRMSLRGTAGDVVPLQEELAFADAYLDVERARFGDSLRVEVQVDGRTRACLVPPVLLQPLVEDAVRRAVGPAGRPGRVRIRAGLSDDEDRLRLEVADDGPGAEEGIAGGGPPNGLRGRLRRLYGARAEVRVRSSPTTGTRVRVSLPAERVQQPPGAARADGRE